MTDRAFPQTGVIPDNGRKGHLATGTPGGVIRSMRPTTDLLDRPYILSQLPLLTGKQFIAESRLRGVALDDATLEALHRLRLLVPFLRIRRDGRAIAAAYRRGEFEGHQVAYWQWSTTSELLTLRSEGRLFDPAREPFVARRRLWRGTGDRAYEASSFLYSPHQLVTLPLVNIVRPVLVMRGRGGDRTTRFEAEPYVRRSLVAQAEGLREVAAVASALEPAYYSRIVGSLRLPSVEDHAAFDRWRRALRPADILRTLRVDVDWLKTAAEGLLLTADRIDPLGGFAELVARAAPDKWRRLKGTARSALDLRLRAELLLRLYDDLARDGDAQPLDSPGTFRGAFDGRLMPRRPLNTLLTDFGLSPHPSLVLVVEGATERLLVPRVMAQLGVPPDDDFIAVEDAEGVDRDLGPLVAYAIAPRVERELAGRPSLRLTRPVTRLYVVLDPENSAATAEQRERRRQNWIDRMMRTLPRDLRTPAVAEQLSRLVDVDTWRRSGESFEFAHFTDLQLARAMAHLDQRVRRPSVTTREGELARRRQQGGSLDPLLHGFSKVDLADALWPILERKIERALTRGTDRRIPVVRVVHRAYALAHELPRRNLGMSV